MSGSRIEKDSFGPIDVPGRSAVGAQTSGRGVFQHLRRAHAAPVVHALALVKKAAAAVNVSSACWIVPVRGRSARGPEVLDGNHHEEFPLVVWQTGSGTQ